jgi:hypothetical protein
MADDSVNRRAALKILGVGVASAAVSAGAAGVGAAGEVEAEASDLAHRLVAPLAAGSTLGRWRVEEVQPVSAGAVSLLLRDERDEAFQLDICARDPRGDAPVGPAESASFQIFLANEGDGATGTVEEHGLAAMAVAEIVRANEASVPLERFKTLSERNETEKVRRHLA